MTNSRQRLIGSVRVFGLWHGVITAFDLLNRREKVRAVLLALSMNVNAALGLVGLAGVIPFVHLMMQDKPLQGDGLSARSLRMIGFANVDVALTAVGLLLVALIFIKNVYALIHAGLQNRFCAGAEARLATELLDRVTQAPYAWLVTRNSHILRDVVVGQSIEWSRGVIRPALQAANDLLFLFVVFGLLIFSSPGAGMVVTATAAVLAVAIMRVARPRIAFHGERKRRAIRLAGVTASEAIAGGRDIRISGAGPMMVASFAHDMSEYTAGDAAGRQWQQVPRLGIEVLGFAALVGVALGALWTGTPRAEVAGLLALYAVVAVRAIPIISQLAMGITSLTGSLPAVGEVCALLDELPAIDEDRAGEPMESWDRLELTRVSYSYGGGKAPVLGPLDLEIIRGHSYGVVGASGAGKSTLIDIIVGLLPAQQGQMLLDGVPLSRESLAQWRKRIAYVAQAPFLIDASLRDNIVFSTTAGPDEEVRMGEVIAAAGLTDVVTLLPQGLDTPLGERGIRLSGGQRQRVAIARALYRNADIIVMDEATSALDSLTEREITEELDRLKKRLTLIVVAHRLSTVVRLDRIIMLDAGRISASGTHQQLLADSPAYGRLVAAQELPGPNGTS